MSADAEKNAAASAAPANAQPQRVQLGPPRSEKDQVMDFLFQQCEVKGQIIGAQGQQLAQLQADLQKQTQETLAAQAKIVELQAVIDKLNGTAASTSAPAPASAPEPAAA